MNYISTRDKNASKSATEAILQGLSSEGGLFVPKEFPSLSDEELLALMECDYCGIAVAVMKKFLTNFSEQEITECVEAAYTGGRFKDDLPAPLSKVGERYVLELYHGPTCAFKDMALQILPEFIRVSKKHEEEDGETVILVATSGDTGKAALEGFKDRAGVSVMVFYPEEGVSEIQKLQMKTQKGENVLVAGIKGNFDDAQSAVKEIFKSGEINGLLASGGRKFSSANSINFGRLLPQVVYYISAYCSLVRDGELKPQEEVNFVVPTGNFGNILAAYYAKRMGLPIKRLICASNKNSVLTDFINTGVYDKNREFFATISPSMDILISSNLERLLFEISGRDDGAVLDMMKGLSESGIYKLRDEMLSELKSVFSAGFCDDIKTKETIKEVFSKYGYLMDTHTAVAYNVCGEYIKTSGDGAKCIVVSTASPYKFSDSVCEALGVSKGEGVFGSVMALEGATGEEIPKAILSLRDSEVRFNDICERDEIANYVKEKLAL